eukprot:m.15542 g.15542  ORF g.15542 m.15542 type:complete len:213 (+) comp5425_c0_seq1:225-863(+)
MAVHTLHRSSLDKEHRASLCSGAFLFQIFLLAIVVVVPYVIAYATAGMWLFQRCYWHQPDVLFEHQAIMVAKGNTDFSQLVWSTSDPFNRMLQNQLRVPSLRSIETDQNRDGVKDKLHLELELPLRDSEDIHSVYLMLFFDFRLNELCSLSMKSLGMIDYTVILLLRFHFLVYFPSHESFNISGKRGNVRTVCRRRPCLQAKRAVAMAGKSK